MHLDRETFLVARFAAHLCQVGAAEAAPTACGIHKLAKKNKQIKNNNTIYTCGGCADGVRYPHLTRIYECVCVCVCVNIYIHIYTHTQTYI